MNCLIGKKIGMTQLYDDNGVILPVTAVEIKKNVAVALKTAEKDGYSAIVLGVEDQKESRLEKPYLGQFKNGITPKSVLKEFKVADSSVYTVGQEFGLEALDGIDFVDVIGYSKGKGFQGVVKRWGFSGGRATHGSKFHRQNGSTGQNTEPSRGFKGVKRAGRMGNDKVTVQNIKIAKVDLENGVLFLKGAVPGHKSSIVYIRKAVKKNG